MTVSELIEKLQKLDPNMHCYILDTDAEMYEIVDARKEENMTVNGEDIAYFECLWSDNHFKDSRYNL